MTFDLVPRDEACVICGDAEATHYLDPFDRELPACRACWIDVAQPEQGPRPRGPDWSERNPTAADHEAVEHRRRVVENAVAQGRVRL